ncbi:MULTISPECIES: hypothetical protein [unclassified Nocardia]|uniref:hypothetical protein n=1 Tax=unclassified Nocardia TaxID=2637762 RepID=UPI00343AC703
MRTHGAVGDVVEFLRRLELWPDSLADIDDVAYHDGVQTMWTTVFGDDVTRHRIPSIRICVVSARVIYNR